MKLQDLINESETIETEKQEAVQESKDNIERYLRNQTVTVQELYDVVHAQWQPSDTSTGQISTWQILDIAKRAILNR